MNNNNKLVQLQNRLKSPKKQYNKFGKYKFRSCADILEACKPILFELELSINMTDDVIFVGERFYIKSTVSLYDNKDLLASSISFAREQETQKGMNPSQITASASSFARKSGLSGLLAIDDTDVIDEMEVIEETVPITPNLPFLTPSDERWQGAINAVKRDGSLDAVLKSVQLSPEHKKMLLSEIKG